MSRRLSVHKISPRLKEPYYVISYQEKGWFGWGKHRYIVDKLKSERYLSTTDPLDQNLYMYHTLEEALDTVDVPVELVYTGE